MALTTTQRLWKYFRDAFFERTDINILSDADIPEQAGAVLDSVAQILGADFDSGDPGADNPLRDAVALEDMYTVARQTRYSTFGYTGDNLDLVSVWESPAMLTLLFTRAFTYTGDDLTSYVTTDVVTGRTLTATITYDPVTECIDTAQKTVAP